MSYYQENKNMIVIENEDDSVNSIESEKNSKRSTEFQKFTSLG